MSSPLALSRRAAAPCGGDIVAVIWPGKATLPMRQWVRFAHPFVCADG
jgi:hypothetical protein